MTESTTAPPGGGSQPADTTCSTCGAPMKPGESRCLNCGTTHGEQHRCPFCRVVAEPEPDPVLRFRCPACRSPRIPQALEAPLEGEALKQLKSARGIRSSQRAWKAAAVVSTVFGLLAVLLMTGVFAIVSPPLVPMIAGYVLAVAPLAFAVLGFMNASKRTGQVSAALDRAWLLAARDLVKNKGIMRSGELASALRIDDGEAEKLLVRLASLDEIRPDVTESGDLAVSIRAERIRVASEPAESGSQPETVEHEAEGSGPRGKAGT